MPVTAVTPVRRPIPSPSLAHSKFTALPDDQHGFTVTKYVKHEILCMSINLCVVCL